MHHRHWRFQIASIWCATSRISPTGLPPPNICVADLHTDDHGARQLRNLGRSHPSLRVCWDYLYAVSSKSSIAKAFSIVA
jgi:hypothetical protein